MQSEFDIDPMQLEQEWLRQPNLFDKYATLQEKAEHALRVAEAQLTYAEAKASQHVRNYPEKYNLSKVVDATVKAAVITHPKVKEATKCVLNCKHDVGAYKAACRTLEHRKRALEKLVDLFMSNYYGAPRQGKNSRVLSGEDDFATGTENKAMQLTHPNQRK